MLSFKALSEKKTKVTLNPKLKDVMEKKCDKCGEESCECDSKKKCTSCKGTGKVDGKTCSHCGGTGYHSEDNTESMEEQAYVSQEEVSEKSNQESETETFLTFGQFIAEMPFQVMGSPDGKKERKIGKPVKSKKYADARAAELADTHKATGGKYRSQYVEEIELEEGRAEDAKASLEKVKARQKVLDAHEKKTGKKLDITKSPEYKSHKQNFPGAKRQEKKVKGAKETDLQRHNRQVQTYTDRLKKYGKTKKQAASDAAMAKHTSRFD